MNDRTEDRLRGALLAESTDISDAQDFARRVGLVTAVSRRGRRRRILAAATACATAAAVAVAVAVVSSRGSGTAAPGRTPAPAAASSSVIGIDWVLVDISGDHQHLNLAAHRLDSADRASGAWLEIDAKNFVLLSDGVNVHNDTYRVAGSALLLSPGATTLVGSVPSHSDRATITSAMDALDASTPTTVGLHVVGGRLVLRAGGYVLTFRNAGPSRSNTPPSGSSVVAPTTQAAAPIHPPDVLGDDVNAAKAALRAAGLGARIVFVSSRTVRPGRVLAQSPPASTLVSVSAIITLNVARYTSGHLCTAGNVLLIPGRLSPPSGDEGVGVAVRNTGGAACTLNGYPQIRITDSHGDVPSTYQDGGGAYVTKRAPTTIVLQPGGGLAWFVVAQYRCDVHSGRVGTELDVRLPGMAQVKELRLTPAFRGFAICSGNPKYAPGKTIGVSPIASDLQHAVGA